MYVTPYVYGAAPYMYVTFSYMGTIRCTKQLAAVTLSSEYRERIAVDLFVQHDCGWALAETSKAVVSIASIRNLE